MLVKKMEQKIIEVINELKPYLNSDGGDIEYVKCEEDIVYIHLSGACGNCTHRDETISNIILTMIQEQVPQIKNVKEC